MGRTVGLLVWLLAVVPGTAWSASYCVDANVGTPAERSDWGSWCDPDAVPCIDDVRFPTLAAAVAARDLSGVDGQLCLGTFPEHTETLSVDGTTQGVGLHIFTGPGANWCPDPASSATDPMVTYTGAGTPGEFVTLTIDVDLTGCAAGPRPLLDVDAATGQLAGTRVVGGLGPLMTVTGTGLFHIADIERTLIEGVEGAVLVTDGSLEMHDTEIAGCVQTGAGPLLDIEGDLALFQNSALFGNVALGGGGLIQTTTEIKANALLIAGNVSDGPLVSSVSDGVPQPRRLALGTTIFARNEMVSGGSPLPPLGWTRPVWRRCWRRSHPAG